MPKKISDATKREAIRLRVIERLGVDEIKGRTGLSVGTLSALLRNYPLRDTEIKGRISEIAKQSNTRRRYVPRRSKFADMVEAEGLSTERKGRIAEAAVLFRLALWGYAVWRSSFEGERVDCVVSRHGVSRYIRIQVKWARRGKQGKPLFALRNGDYGRTRKLTRDDCDFVVGYDLETDTTFVTPIAECEGKTHKTCDPQYAEAWHLLGI